MGWGAGAVLKPQSCQRSEVYSRTSAAVSSRGRKAVQWKGKKGKNYCSFSGLKGWLQKPSNLLQTKTIELWHPWRSLAAFPNEKLWIFEQSWFWGGGKKGRKKIKFHGKLPFFIESKIELLGSLPSRHFCVENTNSSDWALSQGKIHTSFGQG